MRMKDGKQDRRHRFGLALSNRLRIALISATALLAACSDNRELPQARDEVAVTFGTTDNGANSRAIPTTELRKIGVFGYSHMGSFDDNLATLTPDFFLNQAVADIPGNGTWTYTGVRKYWPQDGRYVSFFAYAPFIDVENTFTLHPTARDESGEPTIVYTVPAGILDQTDLIYGNRLDMTYGMSNNGKVELTMNHALTRVDFVVRLDEDEKGRPFIVEFNELTVRNVSGKGKFNLSKSLTDTGLCVPERPDSDADWASYTMTPGGHGGLANLVFDAQIVDPQADLGQINAWQWNRLFKQNQYLLLIPQNLQAQPDGLTPAEISFKYRVTNIYSGQVSDIEEVIPLAHVMLPDWKPGAGVTYQLTVSLVEGTVIEFIIDAFIVPTPWEDQNSDRPITGGVG